MADVGSVTSQSLSMKIVTNMPLFSYRPIPMIATIAVDAFQLCRTACRELWDQVWVSLYIDLNVKCWIGL